MGAGIFVYHFKTRLAVRMWKLRTDWLSFPATKLIALGHCNQWLVGAIGRQARMIKRHVPLVGGAHRITAPHAAWLVHLVMYHDTWHDEWCTTAAAGGASLLDTLYTEVDSTCNKIRRRVVIFITIHTSTCEGATIWRRGGLEDLLKKNLVIK